MSEHPINGMMGVTLDKIKEMVDVDTIIGNPITAPDGTIVIPVSKVTYGFGSGGSDIPSKKAEQTKNFFGGGSGAGVTISPIAFLVISDGNVRLLQISPFNNTTDRLVGMIPDVVDKVTSIVKKAKEDKKDKKDDLLSEI